MDEKLSPERAVRLLRAKAGELEAQVLEKTKRNYTLSREDFLVADIALIATLLADHIEQSPGPWGPEDEDWSDGAGATGGVRR